MISDYLHMRGRSRNGERPIDHTQSPRGRAQDMAAEDVPGSDPVVSSAAMPNGASEWPFLRVSLATRAHGSRTGRRTLRQASARMETERCHAPGHGLAGRAGVRPRRVQGGHAWIRRRRVHSCMSRWPSGGSARGPTPNSQASCRSDGYGAVPSARTWRPTTCRGQAPPCKGDDARGSGVDPSWL